jgi:hypothetical protein
MLARIEGRALVRSGYGPAAMSTNMESSHEAAVAERHLHEILDAIEAGLLQLRRERDELRQSLAKPGKTEPLKKAGKPRAGTKKAASTKKAKKGKSLKVKVSEAPSGEIPPTAESAPGSKAPSKPRTALGRTLTQIRAPRTPGAPVA